MIWYQIITAILGLILIGLNIYDTITTNKALKNGTGTESNFLMAFLQKYLGSFWWIPKMLGVGALAAACFLSAGPGPIAMLIAADFLYFGIVSNNLGVLNGTN